MKFFGYNSLVALIDQIKGDLSRLRGSVVPTFQNVYDRILNLEHDYGTCSTAEGAIRKIAIINDRDITLVAGEKVKIKFTNANTAENPTISINNSLTKPLKPNDNVTSNLKWKAGSVLYLEYDGSYWRVINLSPTSLSDMSHNFEVKKYSEPLEIYGATSLSSGILIKEEGQSYRQVAYYNLSVWNQNANPLYALITSPITDSTGLIDASFNILQEDSENWEHLESPYPRLPLTDFLSEDGVVAYLNDEPTDYRIFAKDNGDNTYSFEVRKLLSEGAKIISTIVDNNDPENKVVGELPISDILSGMEHELKVDNKKRWSEPVPFFVKDFPNHSPSSSLPTLYDENYIVLDQWDNTTESTQFLTAQKPFKKIYINRINIEAFYNPITSRVASLEEYLSKEGVFAYNSYSGNVLLNYRFFAIDNNDGTYSFCLKKLLPVTSEPLEIYGAGSVPAYVRAIFSRETFENIVANNGNLQAASSKIAGWQSSVGDTGSTLELRTDQYEEGEEPYYIQDIALSVNPHNDAYWTYIEAEGLFTDFLSEQGVEALTYEGDATDYRFFAVKNEDNSYSFQVREINSFPNTLQSIISVNDLSTLIAEVPIKELIPDGSTLNININGKAAYSIKDNAGNVINNYYAPNYSPTFSGKPTAPNPSANSNDTTIATTSWVNANDKKVKQTADASSTSSFPVLLRNANENSGLANEAKYVSAIKAQPSTGTLEATKFKGPLEGTADRAIADQNGNVINTYYVPTTTTVAGHPLSSAITLVMSDITDLPSIASGNNPASSSLTTVEWVNSAITSATSVIKDEKVKQTADSSTTASLPLLLRFSNANSGIEGEAKYVAAIKAQPSTGTLEATKFKGPLEGTADKAVADQNGNVINTYYVPTTTTVAGHPLSDDVTLVMSDITDLPSIASGNNPASGSLTTVEWVNSAILASAFDPSTLNITDDKVKQTVDNSSTSSFPVLLRNANENSGISNESKYVAAIKAQPSTGTLEATKFKGPLEGTVNGFTISKTVPDDAVFTDTKNTAGATDTSSKIYLIGAISQAANPQTYTQDTAYVGSDGHLYSNSSKVLTVNDGVVHKAGNETITGVKEFEAPINFINSNFDVTENPLSNNNNNTLIQFLDKNKNSFFSVSTIRLGNLNSIYFYLYKDLPNQLVGTSPSGLALEKTDSNVVSFRYYAPNSPNFDIDLPLNDETLKIPTTKWIRNATGNTTLNSATATKLKTARSLTTKLNSTTAVTFDGSKDQDEIPVSGILPIANGGTGSNTQNWVDLITDQNINGKKTFKSTSIFDSNIKLKGTFDLTNTSSGGTSGSTVIFTDENYENLGSIVTGRSNKVNYLDFYILHNLDSNHGGKLRLKLTDTKLFSIEYNLVNDNNETFSIDLPLADNSLKIPTTEWVRNATGNFTGAKKYSEGPYGTTEALSASEINLSHGNVFTKTISADTTFTITGVPSGAAATFNLILTNGGAYVITWPNSVKWADGEAPNLVASGKDVLTFVTPNGGTTWYGTLAIGGAA